MWLKRRVRPREINYMGEGARMEGSKKRREERREGEHLRGIINITVIMWRLVIS